MSSLRIVRYLFAYCQHSPRSREEFVNLPSVRLQLRIFEQAKQRGEIERTVFDVTTNRQSAFFERRKFVDAVHRAATTSAIIAVADMSWLLGTVKPGKVRPLIEVLRDLPVEIWDASRSATWQSLPEERRTTIILEASRNNQIRTRNIKAGLQKAGKRSEPAGDTNWRKGVKANIRRADILARQLSLIVQEELKKLPTGTAMSPSRLAALLNARDIPSPRGGRWSHNSAKNLLERISVITRS